VRDRPGSAGGAAVKVTRPAARRAPLGHPRIAGSTSGELALRASLVIILIKTAHMVDRTAYLLAGVAALAVLGFIRPLVPTSQRLAEGWALLARAAGESLGWLALDAVPWSRTAVTGADGTDRVRPALAGVLVVAVSAGLARRAAHRRSAASRGTAAAGDDVGLTSRRGTPAWLLVCVLLAPMLVVAVRVTLPRVEVTAFLVWSALSLVMLAVAGLTLVRTQYAWQLPERIDHVDMTNPAPPRLRFSLIIPARDEPVLGRTLDHILGGDYPHALLELIIVISDDEIDGETREIAESYAARFTSITVVAPRGTTRSKPASLEDARRYCTGDLVGVVDAESLIAPDLLGYVNSLALRRPEIGIFQGGVQLMNVRAAGWQRPPSTGRFRSFINWCNAGTSWWRARNCLEYYVWFMSRLRYQAEARFIPLGGNTLFIRRGVLEELDGWDVSCLTEDCDLGVRASVRGVPIIVFYHPALTTREETPESLGKLVVQRTRWMMGFVQILFKGAWRQLPTLRQRMLAVEILSMPFFQAFSGLVLPTSIVLTFLFKAPTGLVILFWLPLGLTVMLFLAEQAAFREFMRAYRLQANIVDSVRLIIAAPIYQFVLSIAALRATLRLLRGQLEWEKTAHVGAHHMALTSSPELEGAS
jgi:cellulose synthase/poly-beta-1,6-N-acetylglucosamine synthase-like glycosyltransferase